MAECRARLPLHCCSAHARKRLSLHKVKDSSRKPFSHSQTRPDDDQMCMIRCRVHENSGGSSGEVQLCPGLTQTGVDKVGLEAPQRRSPWSQSAKVHLLPSGGVNR